MSSHDSERELQKQYYAKTAEQYNSLHVSDSDEHSLALCVLLGISDFLGVKSILDVGSGTGRAIMRIRKARPGIVARGVEPVKELREIAYLQGASREEIVEGDAYALQFSDGSFDVVCEFGMLHHVRSPELAVKEMLRVARKAIFLSDSNNFGQGTSLSRGIKQALDVLGLWPIANLIKTRGRGYTITEGDGLAYSYSVFNNYRQIRRECKSVHLFNTSPAAINPYRTASHLVLLGLKK